MGLEKIPPKFVPCSLNQNLGRKNEAHVNTAVHPVCLPLEIGKTWMPKNGRNQDVVNATMTPC